jgi:hypothetical protein
VRRRQFLTSLLAALLLLQWGTAFAHCLRLAAPAEVLHLDLCTSEGLRTVAIAADESGTPDGHGEHAAAICPACLGPAAATLPTPEITVAPVLRFVQAADPPPPAPAPVPTPPRSCQPRAPPTS